MKKPAIILFIVAMVLSMASCTGCGDNQTGSDAGTVESTSAVVNESADTTEETIETTATFNPITDKYIQISMVLYNDLSVEDLGEDTVVCSVSLYDRTALIFLDSLNVRNDINSPDVITRRITDGDESSEESITLENNFLDVGQQIYDQYIFPHADELKPKLDDMVVNTDTQTVLYNLQYTDEIVITVNETTYTIPIKSISVCMDYQNRCMVDIDIDYQYKDTIWEMFGADGIE